MFFAKKLFAALILPPSGPLLLALFGCLVMRRRPRLGIAVALGSLAGLFALCLPIVGTALLQSLEDSPPITATSLQSVDAIVILGGGTYFLAPEYAMDTVSRFTLERLRYGALLAKQGGRPVLVSGGSLWGERAEAFSMQDVLEKEFSVSVRWTEGSSRDTSENARYSAEQLKAAGIRRIALVSHAWHLRRAVMLFRRAGIEVVPAPMGYATNSPSLAEALLPTAFALERSRQALNEWLGLLARGG